MTSAEVEGVDLQAIRMNKLALVERLADDLAHEIKNPLHSMVINLEVLKRRITRATGDPGELLRYAGVLNVELDRVIRRTDLLLRLVRPSRGGEPMTLTEVVEELLDLLDMERERRGIGIEFHPCTEPLVGHLPRDAAWQMVLNIFLEALDSLPPGATLAIHAELLNGWASLRLQGVAPPGAAPAPATSASAVPPDSSRLSVVRTLAEPFRGRVEVVQEPETRRWVSFALSFPVR